MFTCLEGLEVSGNLCLLRSEYLDQQDSGHQVEDHGLEEQEIGVAAKPFQPHRPHEERIDTRKHEYKHQ
jgi:hypothetical protein